MKQQLEQAEMNASPEAVRLACKRRLRSRLALQALTDSDRGAERACYTWHRRLPWRT
jgi:hypothetical protein